MTSRLTKKQEDFAVAIAKGVTPSDAYRGAYDAKGMSDASVAKEASRLLVHPHIAPRIASLVQPALRKAELTVERTLQEVARLAYSDPRKLFRSDGTPIPINELDEDTAAVVAGVEVLEEFDGRGDERELIGYTKKFKLWDKNAALEKAMKHLGLYEKDNGQKVAPIVAINIALVE